MSVFFDRAKARRSVFKRTRKRDDLPEAILYLEWIGGEAKRKVLDPEGAEHVLSDTVIESHYKMASKPEAKKLIASHWAKQVADKQEPVRKPE